jgi:hypothetical protein
LNRGGLSLHRGGGAAFRRDFAAVAIAFTVYVLAFV